MLRREFLQSLISAAVARPPRLTQRQKTEQHNARVLAGLFELKQPLLRWQGIVVHHTAAPYASLAGIDRYHRKRFDDPLGIEYHFLIGNGKKAPAGKIEVARWQHQARSIHLFKPEKAPEAIAICLVGNFEETRPHPRQIEALTALTRTLMQRLKIPVEKVTTHTGVDGRLTQCPGKRFPTKRFLKSLRAQP